MPPPHPGLVPVWATVQGLLPDARAREVKRSQGIDAGCESVEAKQSSDCVFWFFFFFFGNRRGQPETCHQDRPPGNATGKVLVFNPPTDDGCCFDDESTKRYGLFFKPRRLNIQLYCE